MSETANERGGTRITRSADVRPGEMTTVEVKGVGVFLANVGGTVRALRDRCSHEEAPLSEGELEG
ncbi:Rieske (2Fe-2S) protein [Streptomyces cuspidosporus]|uniref:Rieske domain-containing protein n=1 Tax=Streptomyces cuspidosporus TaxID=66882 RepID=A0ABP5UC79_9ACTN